MLIAFCVLFMIYAIYKAVTGPQSQNKNDDDDKGISTFDPYDYSNPDNEILRDE